MPKKKPEGSESQPQAFGFHIDIPSPHIDIPTPHVDIPAPHVDIPAPHVDIPRPHVDIPAPHIDIPRPHIDIPSPHVDIPRPHVDIPRPHVDIPAPHVDIPAPHVDIPRPHIDIPAPHVDIPRPHVDIPSPHVDIPRPHVDIPAPHIDIPRPHIDIPSPHVDIPRPHVDIPRPHIDIPAPHIDIPRPHVDIPAPHVDIPAPHVDIPRPHIDIPAPHVDIPRPHVDIPAPHIDIPRPHIDIPAPHIDIPRPHIDIPRPHIDIFGFSESLEEGRPGAGDAVDDATMKENVAQRVNTALNSFGDSLSERDAYHSAEINALTTALAEQEAWNQQMAEAVDQLSQYIAEHSGQMAESTATSSASQDALEATTMHNLEASLAQQNAWNQQMAEAVDQLSRVIAEHSGHMAESTATSSASQDALQATTMNNLEVSLAQQDAWNQQVAEAVAQLSQVIAENFGHMAESTATSSASQDALEATTMHNLEASLAQQNAWNQQMAEAVDQLSQYIAEHSGQMAESTVASAASQDALQATAMNNLEVSLAQQDATHQQVVDVVGQLAQGLGETSGHIVEAVSAAVAQLQARIESLESLVAELASRIKNSEG